MSFTELPATAAWTHRDARSGFEVVYLRRDGGGHRMDGCTSAMPVHRLALPVGACANAPAAYVRAADLSVTRLEHQYRRIADDGTHPRYEYGAPAFDFACRLVYDESGLALRYPGIAIRAD
ncbi:putative glycolipid-binding domain-containing protein [Nocardia sp. NBC_01329]|uniref:putative glycolipid-binding domain-containing protein n=1 Tax=Nocardia sp. NBC_01329 TaxID=2903594 RepID=UPI002E13A5B5|nr:putative glycolipid-binding domain-containing protein [Nocardia sp. NBC_01329]